MRRLYDFSCISEHIQEEYVQPDVRETICRTCGGTSRRLVSPANFKLDHTFPGESIKWARSHEAGAKIDTSHKSW